MSNIFLDNPSINVNYFDADVLNTLPTIATQNVVAFNSNNIAQNLNLAGTSNINMQALKNMNIKHGAANKIAISTADNTGASNTYLNINFTDRVVLTDVNNSGVTLTSTNTTIGTTHLTEQSNFLQIASGKTYGIAIENNLATKSNIGIAGNAYLQSDLHVQGHKTVYGNLTNQGKSLASEVAIYKTSSLNNATQVGYSWIIDEQDQLKLVKYTYFNDNTNISKQIGIFGSNTMSQGDTNDIMYSARALTQTGILNPAPIQSMLNLTLGPYNINTIADITFTSSGQSIIFRTRDYLTDTASINNPFGTSVMYSLSITGPGSTANAFLNQSNNVEIIDDGTGSTYSITITANNNHGTVSQTFTVTNYNAPVLPTVTSGTLALWLDASSPDSITMSGNNVTGWTDKSANAFSFSQETSANQPTITASALNSQAGIYFDGTQYLSTPSYTAANFGENNTIFFVLSSYTGGLVMYKGYSDQSYSTPSVKKIWMGDSTTSETARGGYLSFVGNGSDYSIANTEASLTYTVVCMQTTSATNINMYINGTLITNNNYYLDLITDQGSFMTIGGCIDTDTMSSTNLVGYIHEIVHYDTSLNTTDITAVNGYLTNKWIP